MAATPLHLATEGGHESILCAMVIALMKSGVRFESLVQEHGNQLPSLGKLLDWAASNHCKYVALMLVEQGAAIPTPESTEVEEERKRIADLQARVKGWVDEESTGEYFAVTQIVAGWV